MKSNKKIKLTFLVIAILSLSILISTIPSTINLVRQSNGVMTSFMHDDKKLIEDNFYKSKAFDGGTIRDLVYWMSNSVYGYKNINRPETTDVKSTAREQLKDFKNVTFMGINNETGEYYTNTEYKTVDEFKKYIDNYCDIEIKSKNYNIDYKKKLDNKTYEKLNLNREFGGLIELPQVEIYLSIPKNLVGADQIYDNYSNFNREALYFRVLSTLISVSAMVFVISLAMYKVIKTTLFDKNSRFLKLYNKIPLEFTWLVILVILWFEIVVLNIYYFELGYVFLSMSATFMLFMMIYLSVKQFRSMDKKTDIIKQSLMVNIIISMKKIITQGLKSSKKLPMIKRIFIISIGFMAINTMGWFISVMSYDNWFIFGLILSNVTLGAFAYYTIKKLSYLSEIIDGTENIKDGNLSYKIELRDNDNFTVLADNINNIGQGLDNSIEKQLKSERMKSELITNVSHDLKTPLTSIINYIALIKKEENIQPGYIKDYVNVLDSKSKRLQILIEDLFEASKASSGNIELNIESIDLKQLLRQAIGEMEEKIIESNLDIRLNMPDDKVYIKADGRRLYRVLENILSNIVKYSLSNTRVYIDLILVDNKVNLTMKNISSYELNFDPVEIMERFKRGDESRNTDGSGLGLAIARDLVNIQGGEFSVEIDGDLFKSIIEFNIED